AADILDFYLKRGPAIFGMMRAGEPASTAQRLSMRMRNSVERARRNARQVIAPKHDAADLKAALTDVLGDRLLGESLTRLVVPAYHPDRRSVYVFKTSHHPNLEVDHHWKAVDVAMATASAPAYFR